MAKSKTRKVWVRLEVYDDYVVSETNGTKADSSYDPVDNVRAVYVIPVEFPEPVPSKIVVLPKVTA